MRHRSYAKAGVDIAKVRRMQKSLSASLETTFPFRAGKPGAPIRGIGHYAGVIDLGNGNALTMHTDGVGTKVLVAQEMKRFDTVGIDCVAMTVNDLVCLGSEPVALLDYIALEREDDSLVSELSKGLTEGARLSSTAIVGGETAVMRDVIRGKGGKGFDLVSMGVGFVRTSAIIDGSAIEEGDAVLGIASSGLHSNGYTLARRVLKGLPLGKRVEPLGTTLGEALLEPTSIYVKPVMDSLKGSQVNGIAHVTGGAFTKLPRLLGKKRLQFDISLPQCPAIFELLLESGIERKEMFRTFNMGIGMVMVVPQSKAGRTERVIRSNGFEVSHLGDMKRGSGVIVDGLRIS